MKILQKTNEKLSFAEEIDISLANAIRRSALEIPILAIDEVEFYKNDSVLYDEVLALRLGLIPIENQKGMVLSEKCTCKGKGCAKCSIKLKLQAKGPCVVYAKDLKGKAKAVYPDMPIVKLEEGQELELVATAKLSLGINHTKFSPGLVYYRNVPEIEISKDCKKCGKCVEACPKKILKIEKNELKVIDKYKCDLCEACVEECKREFKDSYIKISPGKELVMFIESWGQISAEEILKQSVNALKNNLKQIRV